MTTEPPAHLGHAADERHPVQAALAAIVERACDMGASDLFIHPGEEQTVVSVRRLGMICTLEEVDPVMGRHYVNHVKAMAGADLADHRRPGEGRWIFVRDDGSEVDLRLSTIPSLYGEDVALRLLARGGHARPLEKLGLLRDQLSALAAMLASPSGLILATGPTGAGKTTTLYACLHKLRDERRKINTIEDPIEYAIEGTCQTQVQPTIGVGFSELLPHVLRQAPDVIMIGEIRDAVTAQTAIRAANSGHLVFSTLHAPVAAAALQSMLSLGVHPHFLASCLRGVIAQRLVRVLCPKCKTAIDVEDGLPTFAEIRDRLPEDAGHVLYTASGCDECHRTGFVDRTGIFEVLVPTARIRELIAQNATTAEIARAAVEHGMLELRLAGLASVAQGVTSTEEIVRVVPAEYLGIEG